MDLSSSIGSDLSSLRPSATNPATPPAPTTAAQARATAAAFQQQLSMAMSAGSPDDFASDDGGIDGGGEDGGDDSGLDGLDVTAMMLPALGQALAGAGTHRAEVAAAVTSALQNAEGGSELLAGLKPMLGGLMPAAGGTAGTAGAAAASATAATGAPGSISKNAQIVAAAAHKHGVDPTLAVAMMLVESGGRANAVGDSGTSFGLFQLHKGGMLTAAGMTPDQAFNPAANADVAMRSLASYAAGRPNATPGAIAAASQRPANPDQYAQRVNDMMGRARALLR